MQQHPTSFESLSCDLVELSSDEARAAEGGILLAIGVFFIGVTAGYAIANALK